MKTGYIYNKCTKAIYFVLTGTIAQIEDWHKSTFPDNDMYALSFSANGLIKILATNHITL